MHRCLFISDILHLIAEQLGQEGHLSKKDLAALACTSHAFKGPALDVLWSSLDSLSPLIKCMPADLWEEKEEVLFLRRDILPSDWSRFQYHALRVRRLGHPLNCNDDFENGDHLDGTVFEKLAKFIGRDTQLLPNLHELLWDASRDGIFIHIQMFLGRSVKKIYLTASHWGAPVCDAYLKLISGLPTSCPDLTDIGFPVPKFGSRNQEIGVISTVVCKWNSLRSVVADELTTEALLHLANNQSLRELRLDCFINKLQLPPRFDECYKYRFSSLRRLTLEASTIDGCQSFLTMGFFSSLEKIRFGFKVPATSTAWANLLVTISSHCSPSSLKRIDISDASADKPGRGFAGPPIRFQSLEPLLAFSSLIRIVIHPVCGIELDDRATKAMARAWPSIQVLDLGVAQPQYCRVTLIGLLPFARYTPHLQCLGISINASSLVNYINNVGHTGSNRNLKYLLVGHSEVVDISATAAFLSKIFPGIDTILCTGRDASRRSRWKEVCELMRGFSSVRPQEDATIRRGTQNVGHGS